MKITIAIDSEKEGIHPSKLIDELIRELSNLRDSEKINSQVGWLTKEDSYIAMQRDWPNQLLVR